MSAENEVQGASGVSGERIEVEISDLAPARAGVPPRRAPFDQRRGRRGRLARLLAVLASVLLVPAIVLGGDVAMRGWAEQLIFGSTPVPSATLEPGGDVFYILAGLPWASVTLDRHPMRHLPVIGADPPVHLARGQHVFGWRADPFRPWRCTISVPVASGDTCPHDRGYEPENAFNRFWVLTLYPTLRLLPADQWTDLLNAIQVVLDGEQSSATVLPGESYLAEPVPGGETVETAGQSLHGTLRFHLVLEMPPPSQNYPTCAPFLIDCTFMGQSCLLVCTTPETGSPAYWSALAPVYGTWDYTTAGGQPVARDQPDGGQGILAELHITWDGVRLHVALAPDRPSLSYNSVSPSAANRQVPIGYPACADIQASAEMNIFPLAGAQTPGYTDLSWRFVSGAPPSTGCLGVATPLQAATGTPPSALPPAYVLQRFGVALAANTAAEQAWPELPVADAYEQALAQQLAGQPQG